jgi:uncharacterized protein (DUF2252 family)
MKLINPLLVFLAVGAPSKLHGKVWLALAEQTILKGSGTSVLGDTRYVDLLATQSIYRHAIMIDIGPAHLLFPCVFFSFDS